MSMERRDLFKLAGVAAAIPTVVTTSASAAEVAKKASGNGQPEEGIMVTHEFSADPSGVLKGKGNVPKPKDGNGKFRSKGTGKALHEWFEGSMRELFS